MKLCDFEDLKPPQFADAIFFVFFYVKCEENWGSTHFFQLHLRYLNIGETEKCYCSKKIFLFPIFQKSRHVYDFCGKYEKTGPDMPSSNYSQGYASAALWSSKFGIFLQSCLTEMRDQRKKNHDDWRNNIF